MLRWLFIDMNSFFAAVEQQDNVRLRGRAVGVVPVMTPSTCIIAASVEAKRCAVRTGMPVPDAQRLCPGIVLVQARPRRYVAMHQALLAASDGLAPVHRVYSIDEWVIELSPAERSESAAAALARGIKRRIAQEVGACLTCSAGIGPTRLLAKIASDLQKPDGLTILTADRLPEALSHLPMDGLAGIGGGMLMRLRRHGVFTVEQLHALSRTQARQIWGSVQGEHWWMGFHGIDAPEAAQRRRSMSHAHVLAPAFRSRHGAHGILTRLLHQLGMRLRHDGYVAHAMGVEVSFEDGNAWSCQCALPGVQDTPTLLEHFERLWHQPACAGAFGRACPKKVGVGVYRLENRQSATGTLFPQARRSQRLSETLDRIATRFGSHTAYFGGMHEFRHNMDDKIAFGRIPTEHRAQDPR